MMKFIILYLAFICSVHAFKAGGPLRLQIEKARSQRPSWINMSDKNAAISADLKKKRSIKVQLIQETPGGYICDVDVNNLRGCTNHRIVMSKENLDQFSELAGKQLEVSAFCMYIIKYMIDKGMKLDNTEGMIDASVFPVNYFTLKQLTYFHEDVEDKIVELCKQAPDLSEW